MLLAAVFAWRGTKWVVGVLLVVGLFSFGVIRMRAQVRAKAVEEEQLRQTAQNAKALGDAVIRELELKAAEEAARIRERVRAARAARAHAEIETRKKQHLADPDVTVDDLERWDAVLDEQEAELRRRGMIP
jgi:hypothetical protein